MPIEVINYKGTTVPSFQAKGKAMKYVQPYADELLFGKGVEIGYNKQVWRAFFGDFDTILYTSSDRDVKSFINADGYYHQDHHMRHIIGIEPAIDNRYNASTFPDGIEELDFIISSHVGEHLDKPFETFDFWTSKLKVGGVMFMYLPHPNSEYWQPYNNMKHLWQPTEILMKKYFIDRKYKNIFISGCDAYNGFLCFAEKSE